MNVSFNLPDLAAISPRNWLIVVVLLGSALLTSLVVEEIKKHYNKKQQEDLAKHWVAVWLTVSSAFFTYLGYIIFLGSTGSGLFSGIPYVGRHVETVVGIATSLYLLKSNKVFVKLTAWATTFSSSKTTPVVVPKPVAVASEPQDTFSIPN